MQLQRFYSLLLFSFINSQDNADEYLYGFKKIHSTASCTCIFKKIEDHYRQHDSHVFATFIDFNKAFDNTDYSLLFCNLLDNYPSSKRYLATRLLAYWYNNQQMLVRWQNTASESFRIFNGVRQGGLLSPYLFRFYSRNLIDRITKLNIGCQHVIFYLLKIFNILITL